GLSAASRAAAPSSGVPARSKGRVIDVAVKDLRRAASPGANGTVRLMADVDPDSGVFAVRVPNPGLGNAGYPSGSWIVVRPVSSDDFAPNAWMVILRARGTFGATGADWTIAHVKTLPADDAQPRLQVSYGSATGREFRPERLSRAEVTLAAT